LARRDFRFASCSAERVLENGAPYKGRFLPFTR
jgi:hypothetical protein